MPAFESLTRDHLKVHRPWGSYQSLELGERYQVKRIVVEQGGRLPLQLHHHCAEHGVVVCGTARVTIGDEVQMLRENELVSVPSGAPHRLEIPARSISSRADRQLSRTIASGSRTTTPVVISGTQCRRPGDRSALTIS